MKVEGKQYRQYRNKNITVEYLFAELRLMDMKDAAFLFSTYEQENPNLPYLTFAHQKFTDSALETCRHIFEVQQNILQFLQACKHNKVGLFGLLNFYTRFSLCRQRADIRNIYVQLNGFDFSRECDIQINGILQNTKLLTKDTLNKIQLELQKRALHHDGSKLGENEKPYFDTFSSVLSECEYGDERHTEIMELIKPAIEYHYKHNSHHPEHYENGINGMNLFDIIEMFCDWAAACKINRNGDFTQSILRGKERFGMGDQLTQLMFETKDILGW